ncbi:DUF2384 domain-containing protein [Halomonas sp. TRM85114]|uniref:MbcA/ParS/Xre antitoxin family protein n=1 Tax=Halomonas jincaotanensis TaxID=2810616 RepID=UPI001BD43612|nr:MbcA/ParS/Xre antitoxin family protein [Halomonas jincaotanensis]MBS9405357.1 DUF2384 domain-containing protein [Halomonas jincaotanensis]
MATASIDDSAVYIRAVRRGISGEVIRTAMARLGNTPQARELFVVLLETTSSNLPSYYKRAALSRSHSEAVLDTLSLILYAETVFDETKIAREWLTTPIPALAGEIPLTLCDTFKDRQLVRDVLGKIEYGEFS